MGRIYNQVNQKYTYNQELSYNNRQRTRHPILQYGYKRLLKKDRQSLLQYVTILLFVIFVFMFIYRLALPSKLTVNQNRSKGQGLQRLLNHKQGDQPQNNMDDNQMVTMQTYNFEGLKPQDILNKQPTTQLLQRYSQINSQTYQSILPTSRSEKTKNNQYPQLFHEPKPLQRGVMFATITKTTQHAQSSCVLINGINIITPGTINSIKNIFNYDAKLINTVILILDASDPFAKRLLNAEFGFDKKGKSITKGINLKYFPSQENLSVFMDADYNFIQRFCLSCSNIVYLQSYVNIHPNTAGFLQKILVQSDDKSKQDNFQMLFTSFVAQKNKDEQKYKVKKLKDLREEDLSQVSPEYLCQYIFIFKPTLLLISTPLNFAYYAKYTMQQMIIYPILAILQGSKQLNSIQSHFNIENKVQPSGLINKEKLPDHIFYSINEGSTKLQSKFFRLNQIEIQDQRYPLCFVSNPYNDPSLTYTQEKQDFTTYLSSIKNTQLQKGQIVTIVINLAYSNKHKIKSIWQYVVIMLDSYNPQKFNIRLRIYNDKVTSALSLYQSAHTYCPLHSLIIFSRYNIKFSSSASSEILQSVNQKHHYYFPTLDNMTVLPINKKSNGNKIPTISLGTNFHFSPRLREEALHYQSHLQHIQIFKSDLFKMLYFWILKCAEIDFYQTQASFIFPMLEMIKMNIGPIKNIGQLYKSRTQSQNQKKQIKNLGLYLPWPQIPHYQQEIQNTLNTKNVIYLKPIGYNSLQNQAFRRNAKQIIPRIIHQAWIGNHPINPFRLALQQTLMKTNPTYEHLMWKDENITQNNFPFSYSLIWRSIQYQSQSDRSYSAPIASLIRYEALYHHGGIYIDYKTQGLKSLDNFLKYKMFFVDADYQSEHYYGGPRYVGNGIMGTIKHSYQMRQVLTQIVTQDSFNYDRQDFPHIVGGFILRKVLDQQEFYTVAGYGFQLFSQKPGTGKPNLCAQSKQNYDQDQVVYDVEQYTSGTIKKIGLPCKQYSESYISFYKILAGTWKGKKKEIH